MEEIRRRRFASSSYIVVVSTRGERKTERNYIGNNRRISRCYFIKISPLPPHRKLNTKAVAFRRFFSVRLTDVTIDNDC